MERYIDHHRTRSMTVTFRLTPEEYRNMEERIKITGFSKSDFMVQSVLGQPILIRVGKFESDRLSLEIRRLKEQLASTQGTEEVKNLLLECRALLEQIIKITNAERKSADEK